MSAKARTWPLRRRLVALMALLAALVIASSAVISTLGLRRSLVDQLDAQLRQAASHGAEVLDDSRGPEKGGSGSDDSGDDSSSPVPGLLPEDAEGPSPLDSPGQRTGTLTYLETGGVVATGVIGSDFVVTALTADQIAMLDAVPRDGRPHSVDLPDLGDYRVISQAGGSGFQLTGLALAEVNQTLTTYAAQQAVVGLAGIALTALLAAWLIRRELRPLQDVAATATVVANTPLDRGAVTLPVRVTDANPATEVGKVGAALNTLLGHVETSLEARHRSEVQVRQFVADASHELRTPLASIAGYTELIQSGQTSDEEATHALTRISQEAGRMAILVEDLLLLARLDAGRPLVSGAVDLAAVAADAVTDAHVAAPDHHWRLDMPVDAEGEMDLTATMVTGDEDRLRQVFGNLLTNARVHTPTGTTVMVRVRATPTDAVVTVEDNGPGIAPELQGRIFDRFARGDSSRQRASGSTGLGLAIAQAVVEAHGGSIAVASTPGATRFTVTLPRADAPPADVPPGWATPSAGW